MVKIPPSNVNSWSCEKVPEFARSLVLRLRATKGDTKGSLQEFRRDVDKCEREVMADDAVCELFREFPRASVEAFAPLYGSAADGWGLWIQQQCIPRVVVPDEATRKAFVAELSATVTEIKALVEYEPTGHAGRVGALLVEATLLDEFLLGSARVAMADYEHALQRFERTEPGLRSKVAGVLTRARSRKNLVTHSCPSPTGAQSPSLDRCVEELEARLKRGILTHLEQVEAEK